MSETTEELSTETGENPDISNAEVEQGAISNPPPADEQEDNLAELAPGEAGRHGPGQAEG
jgi:hypothetical protein